MQLKLLHLLLPLLAAVHSSRLPFELENKSPQLAELCAHALGRVRRATLRILPHGRRERRDGLPNVARRAMEGVEVLLE